MNQPTDATFQPDPPAEALDWDQVLDFLPELADPAFVAGRHAYLALQYDASYTIKGGDHSERLSAFLRALYDTQVVAGFDWPEWLNRHGWVLQEQPERLASASLEDCRRLLVALARGDRFTEGVLLSVVESGHLVAILERVRELVQR